MNKEHSTVNTEQPHEIEVVIRDNGDETLTWAVKRLFS